MNNARILVGPFPTEEVARESWCDHEVRSAGGIEREHWPNEKFPGVREPTAEELEQIEPPKEDMMYWALTHTEGLDAPDDPFAEEHNEMGDPEMG